MDDSYTTNNPLPSAMTAYDQFDQPSQPPIYSFLGPTEYPESVALWHSPSAPQPDPPIPVPSYSAPAANQTQTQSQAQPAPSLPVAAEQKKHKRTRSGCFTCRARRIKCDETHPICDRCKKGNRECVYPSSTSAAPSTKQSTRRSKQRPQSRESDSSGHPEQEDVHVLEPIKDEEEAEGEALESVEQESRAAAAAAAATRAKVGISKRQSEQSLRRRKAKGSDYHPHDSSSSPSDFSKLGSTSPRSVSLGLGQESGLHAHTHLPEDVRFYLVYHQEALTYHHYFLKQDSEMFVYQGIVDIALQYEPLLYAVVGFAAYYHSLHTANGKLYTFLKYYNQALSQLRRSLASGEPHTEATLITVLVLTTFEVCFPSYIEMRCTDDQECIGDYVNMIDHHQASHALMREVLTPDSVTSNELHGYIFTWYSRFDVVAGILAGNEMVLGREWYIAKEEHDAQQAAMYPNDARRQGSLALSIIRRSGLDMASLYAKLSRGLISMDDFKAQNELLAQTYERVRRILKSFDNSEWTVTSYPHKEPLTDDDIVDPYVPGGLHHGPSWEINFAWIDYLGTATMFKLQSSVTLGHPPMSELAELAIEQCRIIETIERWPQRENGCMISFKNSLSIAALFLPKDEKHTMWCRRKLALMEQSGYPPPLPVRQPWRNE